MPERVPSGRTAWDELDAAEREARLAQKLRANLGRRKQQGRARGEAESLPASPPALDRDGGDA